MKSTLLIAVLTLLTGVSYGQVNKVKIKLDPKKTQIKTTSPQKKGTNSVAPAAPKPSESNRKRPGGTIPKATEKKK